MAASASSLLLPVGSRVLHIGPHKTGTTTVQFAFHAARPALEAQRVFYPGPNSQPMFAVYAITGRVPANVGPQPISRWARLVERLDQTDAERAVVSSEGFCDADDAAIARIARDLDPKRLHVVVTLRPLTALLSSQWQQVIQEGDRIDFDAWLQAIFHEPDSVAGRLFWHRHRHDELVARWARTVGPDRVTVVVVDDSDHDAVLRVFEGFAGLREGTLRSEHRRTNRSLTGPEIALIRALHETFANAGVDPDIRVRLVRDGVAELLRRRAPSAGEPRIRPPEWARDAAHAVSLEIVDGIERQGVRVIGSLKSLAARHAPSRQKTTREVEALAPAVAAEIAAAAPLAVVIMSGLARRAARSRPVGSGDGGPWAEPLRQLASDADSAANSTMQLHRALSGRVRRRLGTRLPIAIAGVRLFRRVRRFLRGRSPKEDSRPLVDATTMYDGAGWTEPTLGRLASAAGPAGGGRPLTEAEQTVLEALADAAGQLGVDLRRRGAFIAGRMEQQLRASPGGRGHEAWADIGAQAALGALYASGVAEPGQAPGTGPGREVLEPLELARLPSSGLARLLLRRNIRALRGEARGDAT